MRLIYCGVHDAVDVAALDWRTVRNGEEIEVDDALGNDLLEQRDNWAKPPTVKSSAKAGS